MQYAPYRPHLANPFIAFRSCCTAVVMLRTHTMHIVLAVSRRNPITPVLLLVLVLVWSYHTSSGQLPPKMCLFCHISLLLQIPYYHNCTILQSDKYYFYFHDLLNTFSTQKPSNRLSTSCLQTDLAKVHWASPWINSLSLYVLLCCFPIRTNRWQWKTD